MVAKEQSSPFRNPSPVSQAHVEQCQFATLPCPLCQVSVWKNMLDEHKANECQRRMVSCPDCMQTFVFEESQVPVPHDPSP